MKKTLKWAFVAAVLAAAVLFCSAAMAENEVLASGTDGNITWSISDDGVLTIGGNGPMNDYIHPANVPWSFVTPSIVSVIIGENVTSIGGNAFYGCSSLASVTIPNSVTSIGICAFQNCSSLLSVTIPNSVTSIGNGAFQNCYSLYVINYIGTESGWEQIVKSNDWNVGTNPHFQIIYISFGVSVTFSVSGNGSVTVTDSKNNSYTIHSGKSSQYLYLAPGAIHIEPVPDVFSRTASMDATVTWAGGYVYSVNMLDDSFQLDENGDYQVNVAFTATLSGSGTDSAPWQIGSAADWNTVAAAVSKGQVPEGMYFRLTENIAVSSMIGTAEHPFTGTFDGNEKTLTVSLTASSSGRGPFAYVGNAAFSSLRVDGSITTSYNNTGGLLGFVPEGCACTITDCVSDVDITADNGGGHAGFAGSFDGSVTINGCAFTGSITGSTRYSAGFAGEGGGTVDNSVYDGTIAEGYQTNTFLRQKERAANCYYLNADGIQRIKGRLAVPVSAAVGVTVDFGKPDAIFPTSGITAYPTGLVYGGQFYAGEGQSVTFSLSAVNTGTGFHAVPVADGCVFTEAADGRWTLAVPAQGVTIGVNLLRIFGPADFTLPSVLTAVGEEAFAGIAATIVDIPDTCKSIGRYAFRGCTNLTQIRIPEGCALGTDVFDQCEHVCIFSTPGSYAADYCANHANCELVSEYYSATGVITD